MTLQMILSIFPNIWGNLPFMGTVLWDKFGLWWNVWLVLGLNRGRGHFLNFWGDLMILQRKKCISCCSGEFHWRNNVSGVYLVQVSLLLVGQQVWDTSSGIGPCFPLAGGLCKFYANARSKRQIQRQPLLVQYKEQASPLLSIYNYTPLVISGNYKNKQLTL